MNTPDGTPMTAQDATEPIGSALHIAPAFVATMREEDTGIETTIEAHYLAERSGHVITTFVNRATAPDFNEDKPRHTAKRISTTSQRSSFVPRLTTACAIVHGGMVLPSVVVRSAAVVCYADGSSSSWSELQRGTTACRSACGCGTAPLSGLPPVKLISLELDIPERTGFDWIQTGRRADCLVGLSSKVGRPANG